MLDGGGSMVTRISPDKKDFSIVLEKMDSANSVCARGSNPKSTVSEETVHVLLEGSFKAAVLQGGKTLQVWRSQLASGNDGGTNPPDSKVFQKEAEHIRVNPDGTFDIDVAPEELITITTLTTGGKGAALSPKQTGFPLPYSQSFDNERLSAPPALFYDQMGAWEVHAATGRNGHAVYAHA